MCFAVPRLCSWQQTAVTIHIQTSFVILSAVEKSKAKRSQSYIAYWVTRETNDRKKIYLLYFNNRLAALSVDFIANRRKFFIFAYFCVNLHAFYNITQLKHENREFLSLRLGTSPQKKRDMQNKIKFAHVFVVQRQTSQSARHRTLKTNGAAAFYRRYGFRLCG